MSITFEHGDGVPDVTSMASESMMAAETAKRRVQAVAGAFAQRNHTLVRKLPADVAPADRSAKLRVKGLCLALTDAVALPLNGLLQRLSETRHPRAGDDETG
jgi:hypothetical protein